MLRLLLIGCLACLIEGKVVDRLAIAVGREVITELQIEEEIRVTAFLNQQPITRDSDARRAAADRLIAQLLVKHEMQLSRYPSPNASEESSYFQGIRSEFGNPSSFEKALTTYKLTESILKEHLALQLTTLRFIEYRFRPDVGISDTDVETRKTLIEARTDEALDTWLKESRKQVKIVYVNKSLR
ncbi:MAG: hypothetical protein WB992_09115 [Bryobacteraceae bacterium]